MLDAANLELTPDRMREMANLAVERVIAHIVSLPGQPARGIGGAADLCRTMRERAPEAGMPFDQLLEQLFETCIPRSFTASGPGYLAYVPGGGLFPAAVADFIADGVNRYTGVWQAAPALVQLEANVLEWLREWMEFPPGTRGLLTTGGSMANFNAVLCARERHLGQEIRSGVLYTSTHVHHSVLKAARLAGIMPDRVREIDVDADFRLRVDLLERAIDEDRVRGLVPFLVVSSAGTTNTGAVDPMDPLADLCARERLWHHVDGAYGAFFYTCQELSHLLRGLPRADSLTLDPHKGLFLPYGTGALLVRDGTALRAAHALPGEVSYLPARDHVEEFYDPSAYGPELSRGFPGLRVWLCVKLFGTAALRAAIAEKRQLAVEAAARLADCPAIRLVAPPQLSLFAFHVRVPGGTLRDENAATQTLLDRVGARGRVMLSGCTVHGRNLARVCVLSFRTRRDRVEQAVVDIVEEARALAGAVGTA